MQQFIVRITIPTSRHPGRLRNTTGEIFIAATTPGDAVAIARAMFPNATSVQAHPA